MYRPATLCCALLLASLAPELSAQRRAATPQVDNAQPCCSITAINTRTGMVTARVTATRKTFQFAVTDRTLIAKLRIGSSVWMDRMTAEVRVHPLEPCCNVRGGVVAAQNALRPAEPVGAPVKNPAEPVGNPAQADVEPSDPCCAITAIDTRTGIVTARATSATETFQFEVEDAALLRSLKVGQRVYADFATKKVRINRAEPCCNIINR